MFKKATPYLVIAGIALGIVIFWPKLKPYAQKIPVVGGWVN